MVRSGFFLTFALERSGSCTAVRNIVGVAPPLPFGLNQARQHGKRCTITFHTRLTVGYLPAFCVCVCVKVLRVMVFIGCCSRY